MNTTKPLKVTPSEQRELRKHIEAFLARSNQDPTPFIWTKKPHRLIRDHRRMLARISCAAH